MDTQNFVFLFVTMGTRRNFADEFLYLIHRYRNDELATVIVLNVLLIGLLFGVFIKNFI